MTEKTKLRNEKITKFVEQNKGIICKYAKYTIWVAYSFDEFKELIEMARIEIGYSETTYYGDIFSTLRKKAK